MMLLIEQHGLWIATSSSRTHDLGLNVAPRPWLPRSCRLVVTCTCLSAKQDKWESGSSAGVAHRERHETLWRENFLDPTLWWDYRHESTSSPSPDFKCRESGEPLWLNNFHKPAWLDGQVRMVDTIRGPAPPRLNLILSNYTGGRPMVPKCEGDVMAQTVNKLCEVGKLSQAVDALGVLVETESLVPNSLLCSVLKTCVGQRNLVLGRRVHALCVKVGFESNTFVGNHILRMYACLGRIQEAVDVFTRVTKPDAFTWSAIISAYSKHGKPKQAIQMYHTMRKSGVKPDGHVFVAALQACSSSGDLEFGRQVHDDVLESGVLPDSFVCNCLVDMYAKCGKLDDACRVFDSLDTRDVVTWTTMIAGYAQHGHAQEALAVYARMELEGLIPNVFTFACLLKVCGSTGALQQGRQLHSQILERGLLEGDLVVGSCLMDMYLKCGKLEDARMVFDNLSSKNVVTWNTMINGYAEDGLGQDALGLYARMEHEGLVLADGVTFACLLKACASAGDVQQGRKLHSQILERGLLKNDIVVGNCLVDMYAKCGRLDDARAVVDSLATRDVVTWTAMIDGYAKYGRLEDARRVFDSLANKNVVTWTAMIAGYAEHGLGQEALALYESMEHEGLILANGVTFICLLKACAKVAALQQGKQLHYQIVERGLLEGDIVMANCLVEMYAKCGRLGDARTVFDGLPTKDVVTWNTMISGYAEHGLGQEALSLYARMEEGGLIVADGFTFGCLLKACASAGALHQGKQLHSLILERGLLKSSTVVGNCLVEMYAKCGRLEEARSAFDGLPTKDVVTWTAMINGYGQSNEGEKATECFQEMLQSGVKPDGPAFTCLLVACSHEGLVNVGREYFKAMVEQHGIMPTFEHYNCMVDLLGRAGHLDEAENMMLSSESNYVGLMSLLNACRCHGDLERGIQCFESLVRLDPQNASAYVLMANTYADAGMWTDVERIERLRKSAGASKKPAMAGIEVNRHVHKFVVGEERDDISYKVRSMNVRLKEEGGHLPHTQLVLKPVSEKEKEDDLCGHAEKLALAYGLLNTPDGTPLLVTKNLRMCKDCHSSTEIMSRIERRDIVVRDAYRVHRFVGGSCNCGGRP